MADRMILGEECTYSTDSMKTGLNNNIMVCGTSGCGKTVSVVEPCFLETKETSLVVTLTKRRPAQKYAPMFRRRGYDVQILDFANPENSDIGYDPLSFVNSYKDITNLSKAVVMADKRKEKSSADPYWDNASISLLSAMTAYTMMTKTAPHFSDVLVMLDKLEFAERGGEICTNYDNKFESLEKEQPGCFAVNCWKSFKKLPIKTASCVFGTLNTMLDTIFEPEIRKIMSLKRNVDLPRLASRKTVLFVISSPVNLALNSFINMFYGDVFRQLFEYAENRPDGRLPIPVRVICDDFATGGKILDFDQYISIFREKGISVTLLLQSESQLTAMYGPEQATTIINNCDSYVYMGGMDLQTARNISARMDKPLSDVLYMPLGEIILFRRGQKPKETQRYNIMENVLYQEITREYEKNQEQKLKESRVA